MKGKHCDEFLFLHSPSSFSQVQDTDDDMRPKPSKLTIFYGDKVYVYPNISLQKAKSIMAMAEGESFNTASNESALKAKAATGDMATKHYQQPQPSRASCAPMNSVPPITVGNLAQARKASLERFLNRRKHRLKTLASFNLSKPGHEWPNDLFSAQFMSLQADN